MIPKKNLLPYGKDKFKVDMKPGKPKGKLILVTAVSPTPAGEGKTTTTIGLGDALNHLGENVVICLREPSLGPVFGIKGGATGGGKSRIKPSEDINLHFTGDFHAITSANNLLAAMIDNHIYHGNELKIDKVTWKRCLDMNDRALRDKFNITAASEVMAIFCLAENFDDLKVRLGRIVVGQNIDGKNITAKQINAHGAMAALLKDAIKPNLVKTLEGTPTLVHGGPFANIAHGCNSVIATKIALGLADYVVTEAGFGSDLGAEKFLNIKCRSAGIWPDAAVLVATVRAGLENLKRHIEIMKVYGIPFTIALNRFPDDSAKDIAEFKKLGAIESRVFAQGGQGGVELANAALQLCRGDFQSPVSFIYNDNDSIQEKITKIATKIYKSKQMVFSDLALEQVKTMPNLPVCMAKTPYEMPEILEIKELRLSAGAGFVVAICGAIMTMPGLPKRPAAEDFK